MAVGVGATPTTPSDATLSATGPLANGTSELDTGGVNVASGGGVGNTGGILSSVLHSTQHHPSPPKTKTIGHEDTLRRVRGKLLRRHKSHRSSDDLIALQKNAQR